MFKGMDLTSVPPGLTVTVLVEHASVLKSHLMRWNVMGLRIEMLYVSWTVTA